MERKECQKRLVRLGNAQNTKGRAGRTRTAGSTPIPEERNYDKVKHAKKADTDSP